MSYISHTDYTKLLNAFGKQTPKGLLKEGLEKEGNAYTAGLAKTPKGGKFRVGNKVVKDTSNYDAPTNEGEVDEYGYADQYAGAWSFREEEEKHEGLKPAPLQATGQTIITKEGSDYNFSVLSQTEREQLTEYIKSFKTIKEEINKLVGKARGVEEGGDNTNLVMNELGPDAIQSAGNPGAEAEYRGSLVKRRGGRDAEEIESTLSPELHDKVHRTLDALKAALKAEGKLTGEEIEMFLKHEVEEKDKEARNAQHDPY